MRFILTIKVKNVKIYFLIILTIRIILLLFKLFVNTNEI